MNFAKDVFMAIVVFVGLFIFIGLLWTFMFATKTVSPTKILHTYEYFFETKVQYDARLNQIKTSVESLALAEDSNDRMKIRLETAAMRQSCRELAGKYNAASVKMTTRFFKDRNLPETLNAAACEGK